MTDITLVRNASDSQRLVRVGAIGLAAAAVLFVLDPAIRPFADEKTLEGAAAFASNAWTVAHVFGMLGFIGLGLGLLGLPLSLMRIVSGAAGAGVREVSSADRPA